MGLEVKRPNSFRSRAEDAPAALTAFSRYSALAVVPEAVAMPHKRAAEHQIGQGAQRQRHGHHKGDGQPVALAHASQQIQGIGRAPDGVAHRRQVGQQLIQQVGRPEADHVVQRRRTPATMNTVRKFLRFSLAEILATTQPSAQESASTKTGIPPAASITPPAMADG